MAPLVSPRGPSDDSADLLLEDPKLDREVGLLDSSGCVAISDGLDLICGQLRHSVTLTSVHRVPGHSTLGDFVGDVLGVRSKEPMGIVVAVGDIARVEDPETIRDGSDPMPVAPSGRGNHPGASTLSVGAVPEESVGASSEGCGPGPAFVWPTTLDFLPVPFFGGLTSTHDADHNGWMF